MEERILGRKGFIRSPCDSVEKCAEGCPNGYGIVA